jgi:hypothetical protein
METDSADTSVPVSQEQISIDNPTDSANEKTPSQQTIDDQTDLNTKNESKFRENFYRLIISQLFYDGYQHIAVGLSGSVQVNK